MSHPVTARPARGQRVGSETAMSESKTSKPKESGDPSMFFNRELSWLDFNQRVLEIAEQEDVPLLERVKFCAIYSSNLDEFFMVRVAGLWDQVDAGIDARGPDGLSPTEQIEAIRDRTLELDRRLNACFFDSILPALAGV